MSCSYISCIRSEPAWLGQDLWNQQFEDRPQRSPLRTILDHKVERIASAALKPDDGVVEVKLIDIVMTREPTQVHEDTHMPAHLPSLFVVQAA